MRLTSNKFNIGNLCDFCSIRQNCDISFPFHRILPFTIDIDVAAQH